MPPRNGPRRAPRALVIVHSYYLRDTRPRRHAAALAGAGWRVDVLCARDTGEPPQEEREGVRIRRLPARRRRGSKARYAFEYLSFTLLAGAAAAAAHLRHRYRLVYVIGVPNFLVFAALVPRLTGARVLLDMRDPMPEFFRAKYGLGEEHSVVRALLAEERLSARFASQLLTVHPSMARLYRRTGIGEDRISVVMNAPDPRLFAPAETESRHGGDRTLLYAGTVARRYGVDVALRAVARLRDEIPGLRLRVVGDGDLVPALRRLARAEGVAERVIFDAPVSLDQVPEIVGEAWMGIQPNRDDPLMRYSLSAKILEWCRLGLPVVCGATPPLEEIFGDGTLLMHPPGDLAALCERIREAHRDPRGLRERVRRAREAAERIRYEDQIARFLALADGRPTL